MEGKRKKKDAGDESPGYEDLLDGFAFEQRGGEDRADLDGLALAELLGEDNSMRHPGQGKEDDAIHTTSDDYSDLARQFETLDLTSLKSDAFDDEESEPVSSPPLPLENTEIKTSFDGSLEIGSDDLDTSMGYASLLDSIDTDSPPAQIKESADFDINGLNLDDMPGDGAGSPESDRRSVFSDFDIGNNVDIDKYRMDDEPEMNAPVIVPVAGRPDEEVLNEVSGEVDVFGDFFKVEKAGEHDSASVELMDEAVADEAESGLAGVMDEMIPDETAAPATAGYADVLGDMLGEGNSIAPDEKPVLFETLYGEESAGDVLHDSASTDDALSLARLIGSVGEGKDEGVLTAERQAADEPEPEPEHDFLGLSSLGISTESQREEKKKARSKIDVLYEGVEMDFDEQIADVTLAELLLAQGKRKEAAELYTEVSRKKGVTSWVAKRLRALTSAQDR